MDPVPPAPARRSGILLAGGRSTRMGAPKALLDLGGEPMVRRVARALESTCDELVVVAAAVADEDDARMLAALGSTAFTAAPRRLVLARDPAPGLGPVAGMVAGLAAASAPWAIVVPCDLPLLAPGFVAGLFRIAEGDGPPRGGACDAVVPRRGGHWEPMPAVYRRDAARAAFGRALAERRLRFTSAFADLAVRAVGGEQLAALDPGESSLLGVNDPAEHRAALRRLGGRDDTSGGEA